MREAKRKGVTAAVGCLQLISRVGITDVRLALQFYRSLVDCVIKYGMAAGHPGVQWAMLDSVYYDFVRSFMKIPSSARNDVIGRLTGYMCSSCSYNLETILYCRRLANQSGPELAYSILREMWREHSMPWIREVLRYGSEVCPDAFSGLRPNNMFDDFEYALMKANKQQWTSRALHFCHSSCLKFRAGSETSNLFLNTIMPSFIGLHWVFQRQGPRSRATVLILTGSWRWARENLPFVRVSRVCNHCRVRDSACHLLLDCHELEDERRELVLKLAVVLPALRGCTRLIREVIKKALSDPNGSELLNDFCFKALTIRKLKWVKEMSVCVSEPEMNELLLDVRNLFI
jgi:hypothetical protein